MAKCDCCGKEDAKYTCSEGGTWPGDVVGASYCFVCLRAWTVDQMVESIRTRRASAPKFYGTMPSVLPQTLPAGTRTLVDGVWAMAASGAELFYENGYIGDWLVGGDGRTRRRGMAHASVIDWATAPIQEPEPDMKITIGGVTSPGIVPIPITSKEQAEAVWGVGSFCSGVVGAFLDDFTKPETCRECSKPERPVLATHGELCVYCERRGLGDSGFTNFKQAIRNAEASDRLAAFDKRNAPRQTADSRDLAKAHPWSCDENEP